MDIEYVDTVSDDEVETIDYESIKPKTPIKRKPETVITYINFPLPKSNPKRVPADYDNFYFPDLGKID